ncbi:MAG: hypothetical protein FRX48_07625 [Lasallia pustulata]|uniref:F-box domain-containing protein n=1 Tax=Lasallia pustulata TaxID=136370 RepID=A0A5M8PHM4_9LECA|nr:MAG: hypothetical protein FRX48_07625 [Lasallia pustulata]
MLLTDLPTDVLFAIFPYLDAQEFLSLTSSAKALLSFRLDPTFWRTLTRTTFRIPPQPLLQADGARWQWLYRNLLTQTRVFTWGNNEKGNLGHGYPTGDESTRLPHYQGQWRAGGTVGWPARMEGVDDVGVVADLQCGGWSTTLLSADGALCTVGVLDGEAFHQAPSRSLVRLHFPPGYPMTAKSRYEPATAIQQFSAGRSHVLGLADNGKVWMWHNINGHGWNMRPLHIDLVENGPASGVGRVTRVVAGWDKSTIYINGTGIIFWPYEPPRQQEVEKDTLEFECFTVPGTGYHQRHDDPNSPSALEIGEVTNHIALERYIVFKTRLNKVFLYDTTSQSSHPGSSAERPIEITSLSSPDDQICDVQGSFRNFAVFTASGKVLIADLTFLNAVHAHSVNTPSSSGPLPQPTIIPALQNTSVISLTFGDYHFHALHSTGLITSWGRESRACGALGLGPRPHSLLRGVRADGSFAQDGLLEAHKIRLGRSVWFEPEKRVWLQDMVAKAQEAEAVPRWRMINDRTADAHIVVSEWFEREGRAWAAGPTPPSSAPSSTVLPAFFALKVSAAGWHSGALVLVDEAEARRVERRHVSRSAAVQAAELDREFEGEFGDAGDGGRDCYRVVLGVCGFVGALVFGLDGEG